jgi:amidase
LRPSCTRRTPSPLQKIQGANVGDNSLDGITPFFQISRVVVPAGMNDVVVEPQYALNQAKTDYISIIAPDTSTTKLPHPMPIAMTFFASQGDEPTLIKIGTAYESATHQRTPPQRLVRRAELARASPRR